MTAKRIIAASAIGAALTLLFGALAFFDAPDMTSMTRLREIFFIPADLIVIIMDLMGIRRLGMKFMLSSLNSYYIPPARWFVSAILWGFVFSVMAMRIISHKDRFGGRFVNYFLFVVWEVVNVIAAIATLFVVYLGIDAGRKSLWYFAGIGVFIAAIVAIFRNLNYSLLYLFLACVFFFSSCVTNFRWYGG